MLYALALRSPFSSVGITSTAPERRRCPARIKAHSCNRRVRSEVRHLLRMEVDALLRTLVPVRQDDARDVLAGLGYCGREGLGWVDGAAVVPLLCCFMRVAFVLIRGAPDVER